MDKVSFALGFMSGMIYVYMLLNRYAWDITKYNNVLYLPLPPFFIQANSSSPPQTPPAPSHSPETPSKNTAQIPSNTPSTPPPYTPPSPHLST